MLALYKVKQILVNLESDTSCYSTNKVERHIAFVFGTIQLVHVSGTKE
jgi:hypothetical protein